MARGVGFDVVVIAASQRDLAVCRRLLEPLPHDFPAACRPPGIGAFDRAGLERVSCDCYRMVRDEYERLLG